MCEASVSALKASPHHDLVDRLVDDLLEARHVDARLLRVEVHVALELGVVELLVAVDRDAEDLLDAGDADARKADARRGRAGLDVGVPTVREFALVSGGDIARQD